MSSITLQPSGPREVVDETRADEIISEWRTLLLSSTTSTPVTKVILTNKSYTLPAANLLASFFTTPINDDIPAPATTVEIADLSDIIASRMEEEGLAVLTAISNAFQDSPLIEVDLSDNAMGSKGISASAGVLGPCQLDTLQKVSLCNNGLNDQSMDEVADILIAQDESTSKCIATSLTKVHFFNNMSGDGGCKALARILEACAKREGEAVLQDLRFSGTRAGREGSILVANALCHLACGTSTNLLANLEYVDLADNNFGTEGGQTLAKAFEHCPKLQHLNLRDCCLEDEATGEICQALLKSKAPLEHLDVSGNEITAECGKAIGQVCAAETTKLKVLHTEENELGSKGVKRIMQAIGKSKSSLEEIRLGCNECGKMGAQAVLSAASVLTPSLKVLHLDGNMFPEEEVGKLTEVFGEKVLGEMEDNDAEEDVDEGLSEDEEDDGVEELTEAMGKVKVEN